MNWETTIRTNQMWMRSSRWGKAQNRGEERRDETRRENTVTERGDQQGSGEDGEDVTKDMGASPRCPEQCRPWQLDYCGLLERLWLTPLSHISSTYRQNLLSGINIWWSKHCNNMQDFVWVKEAAEAWTQHSSGLMWLCLFVSLWSVGGRKTTRNDIRHSPDMLSSLWNDQRLCLSLFCCYMFVFVR